MVERMEVYKALCLAAAASHPWGRDMDRMGLVPVVVYNGSRRWKASVNAPPAWIGDAETKSRPSYRLVDFGALGEYDLAAADVAGALARLERAKTAAEFQAEAEALTRLLAVPKDAGLRRAFSLWIAALMQERGLRAEQLETTQLLAGGEPMIAETMDRWTQEWFQQGRREGVQEQKALLRQQAERKFGPEAADELARLLEHEADPARMLAVAVLIVDCETGDKFLDRVR